MPKLQVVETAREPDQFNLAYAEILAAKAAVAALEADDDACNNIHDQRMTAAMDRLRDAEWRFLQTPAKTLSDIKTRGIAVLDMFAVADFNGPPTDGSHRLMLSALVRELARYTPEH